MVCLFATAASLVAGEHVGLTTSPPTPVVHFEASDYTAGSTTWTNRGTGGTNGTTATNGMLKSSGVSAVVFAGKESSNSDRVEGSIGSTSSVDRVTVEMWAKLKGSGSALYNDGSMLFSWKANAAALNYNMYHYQNRIGFNTIRSELYGIDVASYVGVWTHFVFVMSDSAPAADQKIYVNGVLQTLTCNPVGSANSACTNSAAGRIFNAAGDFLFMDNNFYSNTWNARADIGMLRVYNSELSQAHVTDAFTTSSANGYFDTVAPAVSSVSTPSTPSTTRNLSYSYTFSESITGLSGADFSQNGTATGCDITPAVSYGLVIQVNVECTSDGTVILKLASNSVTDIAMNTGPSSVHTASTVTVAVPIPIPSTTTPTIVVPPTIAPPTTVVAPTVTEDVATNATPNSSMTVASSVPATLATRASTTTVVPVVKRNSVPTTISPASVVPTTTTTTTTTTTVPTLSKIAVPALVQGGGALRVNGRTVSVEISRINNQVIYTSETFVARLNVVKRDGSLSQLNASGDLAGSAGDSISAEFTGLTPGSGVEVRMYSDPTLLGRTKVDKTGAVSARYEIPLELGQGGHSFAVIGIDGKGDVFNFFAPVKVGAKGDGPGALTLLLGIPVLLAAGFALFLPPIVKKRRRFTVFHNPTK